MKNKQEFGIKQVQKPVAEEDIRRPALPRAKAEDVQSATSSCVNHLCGCKN